MKAAIIRATVKVSWRNGHGERVIKQVEEHFSPRTPQRTIDRWKKREKARLEARIPATVNGRAVVLGTLKADALRYYPLIRHHADWVTRRSEIRAWLPHLGDRNRHSIEREDILRIRGEWRGLRSKRFPNGVSVRTCNNRVSALKDLYKKLDGDDAPTPCDSVRMLTPPRTPIQRIDPQTVNDVLAKLLERAQTTGKPGRRNLHALKDRAWLMVLAATGKRPCEVERTQPGDVNLEQRVWGIRDAKGGWSEGLYLNDEMLHAWREFFAVDAFGHSIEKFAHRLQHAGWPKGIRPYNNRHTAWITASERGADLSDVQAGAGHRSIKTTREHYVPVLNSRMQKLSELLDHRFGWLSPAGDPDKTEAK